MQFDLITRSADKLLVVLAVASLVLLFNIHNLALLIAIMTLGGMLGLIWVCTFCAARLRFKFVLSVTAA